ncbi:MAG TPA: thiol reductase thioredoxin [Firmicutes bacterium]|nr:thiol reductase thioredoxin [Bacillota bacterium]
MVKHIKTTSEFDSIIRENHIVIVDFFANWCSPCRMMGPVLDEVSAEHPEWTAVKVDCDTLQELAFRFGVSSIPHFEVIVDGKSVGNIVGAREKEIFVKDIENLLK